MEQKIIRADENYKEFMEWLRDKRPILVCDGSIDFLTDLSRKLEESGEEIIRFSDFQPNPLYESVVKGVEVFHNKNCDSIIAVGGGSAIDVAKCIKIYSNMSGDGADGDYLKQEITGNNIPFLAMPTTAGTGSEATKYAVIYYNGKKQSITSENCIPTTVLLDASALKTLPLYQKKSTMLDALCHAVESFWSVNSTEVSKGYSRSAIMGVLENMEGYLANTKEGNAGMLQAAHIAGKAINITQTTAGHAMCYGITSLFGVAHGHAAALCIRKLWPFMIKHMDGHCSDPRGKEYLGRVFEEIAKAFGCLSAEQAAWKFNALFLDLDMDIPDASDEEVRRLANEVNPVRVKNNPVRFSSNEFYSLYGQILNTKEALVKGV
ncbi:iron-containing alcohol dehydrogenase [Clostridiaceae bacterium]|nr:iron-containing alcohol dehydrogenase [Clostridiaceae bacterium]RKI10914.1 iron-containing alcohol dehydrogenase [bacterium 1XD21-70]